MAASTSSGALTNLTLDANHGTLQRDVLPTPLTPGAAASGFGTSGFGTGIDIGFATLVASISIAATVSNAGAGSAKSTSTAAPTTVSVAAPSWISSLSDSVIKADMTAASASGSVSETAMARLFSDLGAELTTNKTTLSASQLGDLNKIAADLNIGETASPYVTYITNALIDGNAANASWTGGASSTTALGNLAVGCTATQVNELDGKWFLGTDLPSSSVTMSGASTFSVSYSAVTNPVFGAAGPSMNDVNQGYLGDCYLLASLAEVARQNPSLIQSMITNNGNNTYGVRFFFGGSAEYVTVNNALADGGTVFNGASNIWASLVEKAYAQLQSSGVITGNSINYGNSFSTIGNGGAPEYALEAITGASTITDYYASGSSWNKYVYADTFGIQSFNYGLGTASVLSTLVSAIAGGSDAVLCSRTNAIDSSGKITLVANHAMSIYGYDSNTGQLEIRNPWGTQSWQYWDTTFEVSLNTLLAAGDTISIDSMTAVPSPIIGALVSAAAGLQANAAVTSFSILDSSTNVSAAFASLAADTKLSSITLTDSSTPALTLTASQYSADAGVLAKITSKYALTVTGVLVSAAAGLQANGAVTSFSILDSSTNVSAAFASLAADTKLSSITLTDTSTPALTLTASQYSADAGVLAKIASKYALTVTGVLVSAAAGLQANGAVTSFSVFDSSTNLAGNIAALNGEGKLSSIAATDSNPLQITYAQFTGDQTALGKLSNTRKVSVSGVTAANAATVQTNTHVALFQVSDTAANVKATLSSLNADSKLSALTVSGTASADTLTMTGFGISATINMNGDTASVSNGLVAPILTFIGTPDAITLGTGASTINYALQYSSGIETIANFQYGLDQLNINLNGAANSILQVDNTSYNGQKAIGLYSSADPTHGVVLTNVGSGMTAALLANHLTFSGGHAVIN